MDHQQVLTISGGLDFAASDGLNSCAYVVKGDNMRLGYLFGVMGLLMATTASAEPPKRNLDQPEDLLNAIYADYRVIKECGLSTAEMGKLKLMLQAAEKAVLQRKPSIDTNSVWNSNIAERNIATSLLGSLPGDYNIIALAPFLPGALMNNVSPLMCQSAGYIMLDLLNRAAPEIVDAEFRRKNAKDF